LHKHNTVCWIHVYTEEANKLHFKIQSPQQLDSNSAKSLLQLASIVWE